MGSDFLEWRQNFQINHYLDSVIFSQLLTSLSNSYPEIIITHIESTLLVSNN